MRPPGANPPERLQTKLSRASFSLEDRCLRKIRFQSPVVRPRKKKTKWDFRVEFHDAILLLVPLSDGGLQWIERHIGADNGYQPYYPTVILEPRYIDDVLGDMTQASSSGETD